MDFLNKFDKQQVQKITLIVIAALTILALVLLLVIIIASVNPALSFGLSDGFSDLKEIEITEQDLKTGSLVLADENHKYKDVDAKWLNLVEGCKTYRNEQLEAEGIDFNKTENLPYATWPGMQLSLPAMEAAHKMLSDAKEAVGQKAILIDGTYGTVYHGGADKEEFKTGYLMFLSDNDSEANDHVELSKEYRKWLREHAAEYGFIESFEDGYRYVGVAHAKAISESKDIESLADYIEYLKDNTSVDKTIEIEVDGDTYKSYYVSCKKGDTIRVPDVDADDITISGTNEGGVIVTVKVK